MSKDQKIQVLADAIVSLDKSLDRNVVVIRLLKFTDDQIDRGYAHWMAKQSTPKANA